MAGVRTPCKVGECFYINSHHQTPYLTETCSNAQCNQCVDVEPGDDWCGQCQQCRQQSDRPAEPADANVVGQLAAVEVGGNVAVVEAA